MRLRPTLGRLARLLAAAAVLLTAPAASADQWNERTTLTFSSPVLIPGATLPAGTYVFELGDPVTARDTVRVLSEDRQRVFATAPTIPIKRPDPSGHPVLMFNPTDQGIAPALKAYFYPNSVYGHEFVYPEEQAQHIAERSKTIVLSRDLANSDATQGRIRAINPDGSASDWAGDAATVQEWAAFRRGDTKSNEASAPLVRGNFKGTRVDLDDLESEPAKYFGQTVSVDGEIERVLGPRLFTIDEPNWADLDGELLVVVPTHLAAKIRDDDRVTITGELRRFTETEVEKEWSWFGMTPEIDIDVNRKPVLVASQVVGGNNDVALLIRISPETGAVGTSGSAPADAALDNPWSVGRASDDAIGRHARLDDVEVSALAAHAGGFFVRAGDQQVFVMPAETGALAVQAGDRVSVDGIVMQMPRHLVESLPEGNVNDDIYLLAVGVDD